MRIAIIGAGPAGLTCAYKLSKEIGEKISSLDVYEASESVGGMSRSLSLWGQTVDLGPHRFFSKDKMINQLWLEIVGNDYDIVNRKTRIYYKKRFFDYPIRAFNALQGLGPWEALRCVASYIGQKINPTEDTSSFEGWVTNRFGKRLYTIFFKTYSEKLWGIKCTELDSDFASQRIKKLSLFEAIRNAMEFKKNARHATLADQFAYPNGGTGSIYEKMKRSIEVNGGKIYLNSPVKRVHVEDQKAEGLELPDGNYKKYDHVISSMPLTILAKTMGTLPQQVLENVNSLRFRNTILVYLRINHSELFPDQWLYIHDNEVETGRITNFRNWVPELYGSDRSTILCMEYWCNFDDEMWNADDKKLADLATKEIQKIGLLKNADIMDSYVFRIPRCYPVYFKDYQDQLLPVQDFFRQIPNLHIIGRYGAYKYNNQDHSILMGMLAAENILLNKGHDLWGTNTDYGIYQEEAMITRTGLQNS